MSILPMGHTKKRLLVCLLAALATACNAGAIGCSFGAGNERASSQPVASEPPPAKTNDGRPKIVVLGDSLTAGLGLAETQSYPHRLQEKIDAAGFHFDVVNGGVSGDTSAGGLRRLDWVLQEDVRVLIVALGANDGLRGLSVAEMKQNLAQIIEKAQARHVAVVLAGMEAPPNYGAEYAASFRRAYRDLASHDGIHPNPEGAAIVADTIWNVLKPLLDQISVT
jgi:acyl-CoA thioesterase-1